MWCSDLPPFTSCAAGVFCHPVLKLTGGTSISTSISIGRSYAMPHTANVRESFRRGNAAPFSLHVVVVSRHDEVWYGVELLAVEGEEELALRATAFFRGHPPVPSSNGVAMPNVCLRTQQCYGKSHTQSNLYPNTPSGESTSKRAAQAIATRKHTHTGEECSTATAPLACCT